jgi:ketosteroid isomerase-like protein
MTTPDANIESLRRLYEATERDGREAGEDLIDEIFDPEVEFSPLLAREVEGRSYHGPDGMRTFFGELREALGEYRYERPEYRSVGDDLVVVLTRLVGTGRGSTVPIGQELALVCEFHAGLVRRLTAYATREEALRAAEELAAAEKGFADA